MAKILVLGNEQTKKWSESISNSHFIQMPVFSLGEDGERKLCEFVINNIDSDSMAIVVDVDEISKPELCLAFAMAIRLSILDIKSAALSPILFISRATQDILIGYKYSPIILTGSIVFDLPENASDALEVMEPLSPSEYKTKFLDVIKIIPNATEGRHSLANQWGADVLSRIVVGNETNNELIKKARLSLYFRYVRALSLGTNDIENIIQGVESPSTPTSLKKIDAAGKKILLIDDEADKGWGDVLCKMLPNSEFKTIQEQVPDYEHLSNDAKKEIESGKYDLIFLDLRMNGVAEEDTLRPDDFSGMKILKAIKEQNKGNQVIMFTASNKAWNMKALLDAGADGYYIKESPEYSFPILYSESNAREFCASIEQCLKNGYLRKVYHKIKRIKQLIQESNCYGDRTDEILGSIEIAYKLLSKSNQQKEYNAYAYLQLFLIIEEYAKNPLLFDLTETGLYLYNGETRFRILKDKETKGKETSYQSVISMKNGHYTLEKGKYVGRFLETNFLISALLMFKFGEANAAAYQWTKINEMRNGCAHPDKANLKSADFHRILDFMLIFFDESKAKWRDVTDAFPDVDPNEQLALLQAKFNKK
jgi:CheY-like chemotaxis protein